MSSLAGEVPPRLHPSTALRMLSVGLTLEQQTKPSPGVTPARAVPPNKCKRRTRLDLCDCAMALVLTRRPSL